MDLAWMGLILGNWIFFQSLSPSYFTYMSSQASSHVECGELLMVGIHPGGVGNWALITDGPVATDHSWASFET